MAYGIHSVEGLAHPFASIDEVTFVLPQLGRLRVPDSQRKVIVALDGMIEHEIDGLAGRQPFQAGDILVAPEVGRHVYLNPAPRRKASLQVLRIYFRPRIVRNRKSGEVEENFDVFLAVLFRKVRQLKNAVDSDLAAWVREFRAEATARRTGYRHRVSALCTEFLVRIARILEPTVGDSLEARRPAGVQIVVAAREFILKNYAQPITLGEIAWHTGKAEEHLARLFRQHTGQTVIEHLREVRIERAKTLLLDPSINLTQIAGRCGFHSLSYFSRTFKELTHLTPSQFRQRTLDARFG